MIRGYGAYFWADGRKYFGHWEKQDMNGFGVFMYPDGSRYDGQFTRDKK